MATRKTVAKAKAPAKAAKKAAPDKQARGGGKASHRTHYPAKAGSIPAPATQQRPRGSISGERPLRKKAGDAGANPAAGTKTAKATPKPAKPLTPIQQWRALSEDASLSELCAFIIEGGHLAEFCKSKTIAYTTMLDWINENPRRSEMYARAREDRSDLLADEIVAISDDAKTDLYIDKDGNERVDNEAIARSRLRVDARKWVAAKLKPRVYGEKLELNAKVDHSKVTDEALLAQLAQYGINVKIGPAPEAGADDA